MLEQGMFIDEYAGMKSVMDLYYAKHKNDIL